MVGRYLRTAIKQGKRRLMLAGLMRDRRAPLEKIGLIKP
jgi:hypothetical protein